MLSRCNHGPSLKFGSQNFITSLPQNKPVVKEQIYRAYFRHQSKECVEAGIKIKITNGREWLVGRSPKCLCISDSQRRNFALQVTLGNV